MTKLRLTGTYIHDFQPVGIIENEISEDRIRELVKQHLGIDNLEWQYRDQIFLNKGFVDLTVPDENGITLALYNHDGNYCLRTYKKREDYLVVGVRERVKQDFAAGTTTVSVEYPRVGVTRIVVATSMHPDQATGLVTALHTWFGQKAPTDGSVFLTVVGLPESALREMLREQAVAAVDRRHGFTMEFAPDPRQHALEYDEEEARLIAEVRSRSV
jgi:hypothetical protein